MPRSPLKVTPARGGDAFGGWFEGVTRYTSDTVINVELQLKAIWIPPAGSGDAATVTFNVDGGIPSAIQAITVNKGRAIGPRFPQDPRKRGSGFTQWETDDGTVLTARTVVNEDMTVTAKWVEKSTWTVTLKVPAAHQSVNPYIDGTTISVYNGDSIDEWPDTKDQFPKTLNTAEISDPNRFSVFSRWSVGGTSGGLIYTERTPITDNVTLTGYYITNFYPKTIEVDLKTCGWFRSANDSKNTNPPNYPGALTSIPTGSHTASGSTIQNSTVLRTPAAADIVYYENAGKLTLGSKEIDVPTGAVSAKFNANPSFLWFYTPEALLNVIGMNATLLASAANETKFSFSVEADLYDDDGNPIGTDDTDYQFNFMLGNLRFTNSWNATAVNGWCLDQINGKMDSGGKPVEGEPVPLPQNVDNIDNSTNSNNGVQNRYWIVIRARSGGFASKPATMVIKSMKINLLQ